jgi:hypothetical protein
MILSYVRQLPRAALPVQPAFHQAGFCFVKRASSISSEYSLQQLLVSVAFQPEGCGWATAFLLLTHSKQKALGLRA